MEYNVNLNKWGRVFAVPGSVVEDYIKLASGSAIKVLLYVLYNGNRSITSKKIASDLNITEEAVDDAFCFWESVGIIEKNTPDNPTQENVAENISAPKTASVQPILRPKSSGTITPKEIAERVENSKEIAFLFSCAENLFGRILTHTEQRSLIWMHDYLGLPADVILMLFEYCKIIGKLNVSYMESVAFSWQQKEIFTHEAAEKEIKALKERNSLSLKVMSAFGINRKLSSKEEKYIAEWAEKNYDIDLISYAYDKTIDAINKLSFPYINKILAGWYGKGLITREQIDKDNENYSNSKQNPAEKEHSYDLDKFESLAINYKK
jgi:DnaD/phage-associated family protein